jgi:hypothetical protein
MSIKILAAQRLAAADKGTKSAYEKKREKEATEPEAVKQARKHLESVKKTFDGFKDHGMVPTSDWEKKLRDAGKALKEAQKNAK